VRIDARPDVSDMIESGAVSTSASSPTPTIARSSRASAQYRIDADAAPRIDATKANDIVGLEYEVRYGQRSIAHHSRKKNPAAKRRRISA
jgi:hypothetical protein